MRFAPSLAVIFWISATTCIGPAPTASAQDPATGPAATGPAATGPSAEQSADNRRQRLMADRYEQLLLRRPRPGTALDRLYAFHASAGTLGERMEQLAPTQPDAADAGNRWLLLGLLHQRSGDTAAAIEALEKAERLLPTDAMTSFLLGTALQTEGRIQPAIAAMQRALERQPPRTEALPMYLALGQLYYRQHQDEDAQQLWKQLGEQFGDDVGISRRVAQLMVDQQRLQPAVERYEQLAATASPQEAITFRLTAARLKHWMGKSDQALADLQTLLPQVRPGSWLNEQVQRQIEDVLLADGGYEKLTEYYSAEFRLHPDDVDLGLRLGQAQTQAQQYEAAATTLRTLLRRTPDSVPVREALVEVLTHAKDWPAVAEQYAALAQQHADHPDYLLQWGTALLQDDSQTLQQRRTAAADVWQRYAQQHSDDPLAQVQVAERLAKINRPEDAEARFRAAIQLAPNDAQYREYLGKFFFENGQRDDAIEAWQAIAAGPQVDPQSLLRLAEVLNTFGFRDEALEAFAAAAKFDLNLPQRLQYVRRLIDAQQFDEALAQWQQAEPIAESDVEQQQLWQQRVDLAGAAGTLPQLIQEAEKRVASDTASPLDAQRLAMLLDADGRPEDAAGVISQALQQTPQNPKLLQLAADLYVQTQRPSQAITALRRLADVDPRSRQTSLRRVIELHLQEGQADQALQLAKQLVDQQPDNPSLWLQYADLCFQFPREQAGSGSHQAGYEALREAARLAPRDPDVLNQLGSRLAADYRTDEAIEIYWQQWDAVDTSEEKIDAVAALAPLYDRQWRLDQLVERLQSQPTSRFGDAESITHQIAIAYEVTGNPGAAMRTLAALRIDRPRDIELLQKLVHLAALSEDVQQQIAFYQDLLKIDRSSQTEQAYLDLLIRTRRLPELLGYLNESARGQYWASVRRGVDTLAASNQVAAAIQACQQVLAIDPDATSIQLRLVILHLYQQDYQPAATLANAMFAQRPQDSSTDDATLALMLQIANMSTVQSDEWLKWMAGLPDLDDRQANALALPLYVIANHRLKQGKQLFDQWVDFDKLLQSTDTQQLWDAYLTTLIHYHIQPPASLSLRSTDHRGPFALVCHLAQMGDARARVAAIRVIANRRAALSSQWQGVQDAAGWTLDAAQLQWLEQQLGEPLVDIFQGKPAEFLAAVANEFRAAGRPQDMHRLIQPMLQPSDVQGIANAIYVAGQTGQSDPLLPQLSQWQRWLREVTADDTVDRQAILDAAMQLSQWPQRSQAITVDQAFDILSTVLAAGAAAERLQPQLRQRWDQPLQRVAISTSSSTSLRVSPLLGQSLSVATMRLMLDLDEAVAAKLNQMLAVPDATIPVDEQKLRLALASAAMQWSRQAERERSLELLRQGIERFPDDDQFRIAFALQAERLQQQPAALEQLELAQPQDPVLVRLKQLSLLRLASYLADPQRARGAAEQLATIPLDRKTKMIVTGQLMRLGLKEQANAFLAETTLTNQDKPTPLETARQFARSDSQRAAAEAAYEALRRGTLSEQQQAIQWLADLDVLPEVMPYLERRRKDNPNSWQLVEQLARMHSAVGQTREAAALRDQQRQMLRTQQANAGDPGAELQAALDRSVRREFPAAFEHFLNVFAMDARTMEPQITPFIQAAQNTRRCDEAFQQLTACDLSGLSFDALRDLMDMDPTGVENPTDRGRAFMNSLLLNASASQLGPLLRELSRSNRLGDQAATIATPTLRRLFSEPQTFRSDAELWNQGQPNTDGEFIGSLQPIVAAVASQPDLKTFVLTKCHSMQQTPAAVIVASTLPALLTESDEQATGVLSTALSAELPQWTGPFAWQAAQWLEQQPEPPEETILALYEVAAADPQLPEAYRWTAGGVGSRLVAQLRKLGKSQAAGRWLLNDFEDALAATLSDERRRQRLDAVAGRFHQLDYPLEAFLVQDTLAYLSSTERPRAQFDSAACADFLNRVFQKNHPTSWRLYRLQADFDQPPWHTSLVAIAVKQLADDPQRHAALRELSDALNDAKPSQPFADRAAAQGLQALVAIALQSPDAVEALTPIVDPFPDLSPPATQTPAEPVPVVRLLDLWTVAAVAATDETPAVRQQGVQLLRRLLSTAHQHQALPLSLVIADRILAANEPGAAATVEPVLRQMITDLRSAAFPTVQRASLLNQLAMVAARHELPELSITALRDVLQLWRADQDESVDAATQRPTTDYRLVSDAIRCAGELVANAKPDSGIAVQLLELLAPQEHPDQLFLYVLPMVGRPVAEAPSGIPAPTSLAEVWANSLAVDVAARDVQKANISQRKSTQPQAAEILLATLAVQTHDADAAKEHLQAMLAAGPDAPPKLDDIQDILNTLKPWTKTIQAMRQTEQRCQQADRWLIPLSLPSQTPELQQHLDEGLLRVAAMLIIDGGAKRNAQPQIRAILETVAERAASESLRQLAKEMLKHT